MKNLILSFVVLLMANLSFSQAFENEKIKLKYYKPSFISESIPETFSLDVSQVLNGETIVTKANNEGDEKEQYYFGQYKNVLKGSDCVAEGGTFKLHIIQGEPSITEQKPEKYDLKDANGVVTGHAWRINLTIQMSQKMTLENGAGNEIYTYEFPGYAYYSHAKYAGGATNFKSKEAAEKNLEEKKEWVLNDHIKWNHRRQSSALKTILKMDLFESNEKLNFNIVVLDVGKKEKEEYADVIALNDKMIALMDKVNAEFKSDSKMNWHTSALKNEFSAMAAEYEKILAIEMEKDKNKEPLRFDNVVLQGLVKNQLWCEFFATNYAVVEEWAKKFQKVDGETNPNGSAFEVLNDLRINWNVLTRTNKNYERVYNVCKNNMKWE